MSVKSQFIAEIQKQFPNLKAETIEPLVADNLISPFVVELPKEILEQAKAFIRAAFELRSSPQYLAHYQKQISEFGLYDPKNKSILMSYDFHISEADQLKLIEINTNASFLALGKMMYDAFDKNQSEFQISFAELKQDILEELKLSGHPINPPTVAIIDESPSTQRLFIEFLVYNELFKSWGWRSSIEDYRRLPENIDFVYNRFTDFYLTQADSAPLLGLFKNNRFCLSPNPFEYFLLADKQRMIDWHSEEFSPLRKQLPEPFEILLKGSPQAKSLNSSTADAIWQTRKQWFFKPKRAFGSKQSYRGVKISHKTFLEAVEGDFIAQEYIPAPSKTFETPSGPQEFKFDLRFFAYQGQTRGVVARLYQGQVTNLKTPLGGFACVKFS